MSENKLWIALRNTLFPDSVHKHGPSHWGGETIDEATANWLAFTSKPLSYKKLWQALVDIRRLHPKRYPVQVWIRVGALKPILPEGYTPSWSDTLECRNKLGVA